MVHGWIQGRIDRYNGAWKDARIDACMDGWVGVWVNGWVDSRKQGGRGR